jgi:hypothetical protein
MNYWAGLNSSTDQEAIRRGANALINVPLESHAGTSDTPRIEGSRSSNAGQDSTARDGTRRSLEEVEDRSLLPPLQEPLFLSAQSRLVLYFA